MRLENTAKSGRALGSTSHAAIRLAVLSVAIRVGCESGGQVYVINR
jgi:hypothetical protein